MNSSKLLFITLGAVALGAFFMLAIWPALHGSDEAYKVKTDVAAKPATPKKEVEPVTETAPEEAVVVKEVSAPKTEAIEAETKPDLVEPATPSAPTVSDSTPSSSEEGALYSVVDGNKLDADSYAGYKLFRNWCSRCHAKYGLGKDDGGIGANLIESLKVIDKETFFSTVENGKSGQIGSMPTWKANPKVMAGRDKLYAYLMARSDGAIGNVKPKKQK